MCVEKVAAEKRALRRYGVRFLLRKNVRYAWLCREGR